MTKEEFKAPSIEGHCDNYIGYVSKTDVAASCTAFYEEVIPTFTSSVVVGSETFYRCGAVVAGFGSRIDADAFEPWWDKFGGKMLTEEQLKAELALVAPEEV